MAERTTSAKRMQIQNVAEREVMRYSDDHARWHKHVHNVELDPMQILKCIEMDQHDFTIDYSCRRTGKTAVKEMHGLKETATKADQETGIVAPRMGQSLVNLRYHLDAIQRSEILRAYIGRERGRELLADTYYQFMNRSRVEAYGIMANVDGGDLTIASLEEVDDMPRDRLYSRFLLMMGSTRRLGASAESSNKPQIRITGVFKGADTLADMVASGKYRVLPTVDVYMGIELGIINENFMMMMRDELAPDEYIRQLLCENVSSRNVIWEKWVRKAIHTGLKAGIELASPEPGETYQAKGPVLIGYDAGGHGENPHSSHHAAVVLEMVGNWLVPIYAKTWSPTADESEVEMGLQALFQYFRPVKAIGDAFGVAVISSVNDWCLRNGVTQIDRRTIGDGQSSASNWPHWYFSPMRFEGMVKHQMATVLRSFFRTGFVAMPYVDDLPMSDPEAHDMHWLQHQLPNIISKTTSKTFASYFMSNKKLCDDLFDAMMAAVWAHANRIAADPATAILLGAPRSREQLLEARSHG